MKSVYIVTNEEMRSLDAYTIQEIGIPGSVLMENAGRGFTEALIDQYNEKNLSRENIIILCGRGNNGGDGFVIARHLMNRDIRVKVLLLGKPDELQGDAELNYHVLKNIGGEITSIPDRETLDPLEDLFERADIIIDGLFGTGFHGQILEPFQTTIDLANLSRAVRFAIDIPSGISGDGLSWGRPFQADFTFTFAALKQGFFNTDNHRYIGCFRPIDISIPDKVFKHFGITCTYIMDRTSFELPLVRDRSGHKGSYGHIYIAAGGAGKSGAAILAGKAALRSGAGLVTLGLIEPLFPTVSAHLSEIMAESLPYDDNTIDLKTINLILDHMSTRSVLAIGPGFPLNRSSLAGMAILFKAIDKPMILDAEALNILSYDPTLLDLLKGKKVVLTPHPGEFSRMTGYSTAEIQNNRIVLARNFAKEKELYLILKGQHTIVCDPAGRVAVNSTGNPGMATAGMGDVLSGVLAAQLADCSDIFTAMQRAVFVHGLAGDIAAESCGERSLVASDLIENLGRAFLQIGETR